jgi:hypothetical protein
LVFTPPTNANGNFTFDYTVNDGRGGGDTATVTVTVRPNTLQVASFTPTDAGFVVEFNRPLTASDLNLYDQAGLLGPADVTVVGSAVANIRGTLVVSAAGDSLTFIRTGGTLPNDTYTITLRAAANAFHDGTNLLDGNGDGTPGDDFVTTIVGSVPVSAITLGIPDFARGKGQEVHLWNSQSQTPFEGIPVLISTGVGVRAVDFTILYDPTLLVIDTLRLGAGIAAGATLDFDIPAPGRIDISVSGVTDLAAIVGQIPLVHLLRSDTANPGQFLGPLLPANAPYKKVHVLDLADVRVSGANGIPLVAIGNDGVHVAAYAGDLSGNQAYNSPDASFIQQLILNQATFGLASYPLVDPLILADINASGTVQASDTSQVQRLIVGLAVPFVPGLPGASPNLMLATSSDNQNSRQIASVCHSYSSTTNSRLIPSPVPAVPTTPPTSRLPIQTTGFCGDGQTSRHSPFASGSSVTFRKNTS